jgi:hypothetical protein
VTVLLFFCLLPLSYLHAFLATNTITNILKSPASYYVCERRGCLPRSCELCISFCNMLHQVILYCLCVIIITVISSMCISSLAVLNGWRILKKMSMHTLKVVYEILQHATLASTNLSRTVLLSFFGKTLFSAKYPVCTRNVANVNM